MGFSCTVYASNTRTYIVLLLSMGVLIVMLSREADLKGMISRAYDRGAGRAQP